MIGTAILVVIGMAGLALVAVGWVFGRLGIGTIAEPVSLDDAERAFIDRMRNVSLVGGYTEYGRDATTPTAERYEIASVEKVGPDRWRFNATLTCCGFNGDIPVVVPLRFVGDTPMIMMTDTPVPGLGTFSVRLFFHDACYAGTWQHGPRRGFMSGRIEAKETAAIRLSA